MYPGYLEGHGCVWSVWEHMTARFCCVKPCCIDLLLLLGESAGSPLGRRPSGWRLAAGGGLILLVLCERAVSALRRMVLYPASSFSPFSFPLLYRFWHISACVRGNHQPFTKLLFTSGCARATLRVVLAIGWLWTLHNSLISPQVISLRFINKKL